MQSFLNLNNKKLEQFEIYRKVAKIVQSFYIPQAISPLVLPYYVIFVIANESILMIIIN